MKTPSEIAREIADQVDTSYMTHNKDAELGLNHNTMVLIKKLVTQALTSYAEEVRREADAHLSACMTGQEHELGSKIEIQAKKIAEQAERIASLELKLSEADSVQEILGREINGYQEQIAKADSLYRETAKKVQYCESAMNTDENERYEKIKALTAKNAELEAQIIKEQEAECAEIAHQKHCVRKLEAKNKELVRALKEYGQHDKDCILAQWRAGRPTEDGGYEMLCGYGKKEKWYRTKPVDESPDCECGFLTALEQNGGAE